MRDIRRIVVKIGSSVLTDERGCLLPGRLEPLVEQVAAYTNERHHVLLVSSGAIACGMARLGLTRRPNALAQLQACAAIGQGELMHLYTRLFGQRDVLTAQVLLTQEDLASRIRFRNAKQTLLTLLHRRVVPVINENDTVAVEEITFGDNDRLAALVASAVDAQLLVILSDVDGFLQHGKPLDQVESLQALQGHVDGSSKRHTTRGGMSSKLEAARIVGHSGIPMVIANGRTPSVLTNLLNGQSIGTLFVPPRNRLTSKKWWIAFALRRPKGAVAVDPGAAVALVERRTSLLASGVQAVKGPFEAGAFVAVTDTSGRELGRGVCNYSSADLVRVQGLRSAEAAKRLGASRAPEVIHRDHLVLTRELQHG
ncbi:MAG: glutamate 5-kinase [Candidatus Omnitrophica bacterium]|nr:glutamate 5-kinase [Candidatus Omnitrophota bacterium]